MMNKINNPSKNENSNKKKQIFSFLPLQHSTFCLFSFKFKFLDFDFPIELIYLICFDVYKLLRNCLSHPLSPCSLSQNSILKLEKTESSNNNESTKEKKSKYNFFVSGSNSAGQLGTGSTQEISGKFIKITFPTDIDLVCASPLFI